MLLVEQEFFARSPRVHVLSVRSVCFLKLRLLLDRAESCPLETGKVAVSSDNLAICVHIQKQGFNFSQPLRIRHTHSNGAEGRRFKLRRSHRWTHTSEKSDPACDSLVVLLRGVRAALIIRSKSLSFSWIVSSIFLGWAERGNHLFARPSAFKGPLRRLPIHTPDRSWSCGSRAYQPREILTR